MRLAVEWTQANVAKFGGDPTRMAIWGHSAGSVAVDLYNYAWVENPIVTGLIMDSGTSHLDLLMENDPIQSNFSFVAANVGCANQTSKAAELDCMRTIPAATLENFIANYSDAGTTPSIAFNPVRDGKLVFDNYTQRAEMGAISDIVSVPSPWR
jgi:carboxylesterase type B